jgi:hypothetical protein
MQRSVPMSVLLGRRGRRVAYKSFHNPVHITDAAESIILKTASRPTDFMTTLFDNEFILSETAGTLDNTAAILHIIETYYVI